MRLFFAIDVDQPARDAIAAWRDMLGRPRGLRWTPPAQWHLTLRFLGDTDVALDALEQAARKAAVGLSPFDLELGGVGCFPNLRQSRVLWVGAYDANDVAARWIAAIEPALELLGFPRESRRFSLHLTLARSKSPEGAAAIRRVIESSPPFEPRVVRVAQIVVYESVLSPTGATYAAQRIIELGH